jgi:dTDP-4-amino-4,6-dideoxygalactose transaminase
VPNTRATAPLRISLLPPKWAGWIIRKPGIPPLQSSLDRGDDSPIVEAERRDRGPTLSAAPLGLPSDQDATGRSFGTAELARLRAVIESGTLTATRGVQTPELEARVAALTHRRHVVACSSGTAAIHAAVATLDTEPGDEIVTTAITDMGALTPMLYQGAIPAFADVDPATGMVTGETVAAALSERSRAVMVTHLFGLPAPVDDIAAVAADAGLPVLEDCAQAYLTERSARRVGSFGLAACFSTQQGKHLATGEGGLLATDDDAFARRARVFVNKGWPYGEADPDHEFLALNLRTTELASAVANAQLDVLADTVAHRQATVARFLRAVDGLPGIIVPAVAPADVATWWKIPLLVDPDLVTGGPRALAQRLAGRGVASAPRYIQRPAFDCRVFREQRTFGTSRWPFPLARTEVLDWSPERFPGTYAFLDRVLVLPWNERYVDADADAVAGALADALTELGVAA